MVKKQGKPREKVKEVPKNGKKKVGRPRLELDEGLIFDLAKIHCTMIEIAGIMRCSVDTLENNYAETIKRGKQEGKKSLRRIQWAHAVKSPAMAIFLGKQYLAQRDTFIEGEEQQKNIDKVAALAKSINAGN